MKKYKIGIIGYGGFGKFLHHWWDKLENVEVVAIADSGKHSDNTIANCKIYHDWNDLIHDPEIAIVSIVTPPNLHAEMACAAMKAGKHVLLEKPAALHEEEVRQLLETQKETGMIITVDHMIRYNPIIQHFIQFGKKGTLGQLRHVVVNNYAQDASLPSDHWFWNEEMSGGILIEHGVHFFDIVHALSGQKYSKVCGVSSQRNALQRDRVSAMVSYNEGLIASYYHAFSGPGFFEKTTISLTYDLARVEIEGWMPLKGTVTAMVNEAIKEQLKDIPGWILTQSEPLDTTTDISRPEGWGTSDPALPSPKLTYCGGIGYAIDEVLSARFELPETKGEVYGKCVQSILLDMIQKTENKDHNLTITIDDAIDAVRIAILASDHT